MPIDQKTIDFLMKNQWICNQNPIILIASKLIDFHAN